MRIHILGIAGTFMGGIALLAKQLGHQVSGVDAHIYPPMSTQLKRHNIDFTEGYHRQTLPLADLYIIGNVLSRGNVCVEEILRQNYHYTSGAQWLYDNILQDKWVLAVAGTHGKTTTTAMLAWVLEYAGLNPSYLVGGVMNNFKDSARLTNTAFFVIEADEYDTAFFDKRSKFVHYHPKTLVINNLEFDHADIFDSLADIQKQCHHLLRLVPNNGLLIYPQNTPSIEAVVDKGIWCSVQKFPTPVMKSTKKGSCFQVEGNLWVDWALLGVHNVNNGIAALIAAQHIDVPLATTVEALNHFEGVKKRLELKYKNKGITIYDDFAHHPTAIKMTLEALKNQVGKESITAIVELGSNTMKQGFYTQTLIAALKVADQSYIFCDQVQTVNKLSPLMRSKNMQLHQNISSIIKQCLTINTQYIVIMSNGHFGGICQKIIDAFEKSEV